MRHCKLDFDHCRLGRCRPVFHLPPEPRGVEGSHISAIQHYAALLRFVQASDERRKRAFSCTTDACEGEDLALGQPQINSLQNTLE